MKKYEQIVGVVHHVDGHHGRIDQRVELKVDWEDGDVEDWGYQHNGDIEQSIVDNAEGFLFAPVIVVLFLCHPYQMAFSLVFVRHLVWHPQKNQKQVLSF